VGRWGILGGYWPPILADVLAAARCAMPKESDVRLVKIPLTNSAHAMTSQVRPL